MPKKVLNPNLVAAGTMVLTNHGEKPIEKLVDKVTFVWNGMDHVYAEVKVVDEFGIQDQHNLVTIGFDNGRSITVARSFWFSLTGGAKCRARSLNIGDKLKGWKLPGATSDIAVVTQITKYGECDTMYSIALSTFNTVIMNGVAVPDERG